MITRSRLLPLALAGTVAAAGLGALASPASASTDATSPAYAGQTSSSVVSVALHLPLLGNTLGLGDPITLQLIGAQGGVYQGAPGDTKPTTSTAFSTVAGGTLVDKLLPLLGLSNTATLDAPSPAAKSLLTIPANPLGLNAGVGNLSASVTKASNANASQAQLAGITLGALSSVPGVSLLTQPLQATLTGVVNTVIGALAPVLSNLTGILPGDIIPSITLPNLLGALIPGSPATITTPAIGLSTLADTVNSLPDLLNSVIDQLLNQPLIKIDALDSTQSITPTTTGDNHSLDAKAGSKLADIELLGGLLVVHGITSNVTAHATGHKTGTNASTANADSTLVSVSINTASKLGQLLNVALNAKGLTADLLKNTGLGATLSAATAQLGQQVDALLNQLNSLLSLLGVKIKQSDTSSSVSADGKTATASASGALVSVTLPTDPTPLLSVRLGASDASASYADQPVSQSVVTPATPQKVNNPGKGVTPAKHLAYTGSNPALALVGVGLLAAGAGIGLRRRRASELS